jgi:hypothetical protein
LEPTTSATPEVTAACGPVQFDAALVDLEAFEPFDEEIGPLIGDLAREEYEASIDWWESLRWSVVERGETLLLLFGEPSQPAVEGPPFGYAQFELADDGWRAAGWGQCRIELGADGFGVATFTLDPNNPPDPVEATLHLLATERACASGQAPGDRQVLPVVLQTADAVEITVLVQQPVGGQYCQGNPTFPITVQLDAPLGDRVIQDAAFYPAEDRPSPPRR